MKTSIVNIQGRMTRVTFSCFYFGYYESKKNSILSFVFIRIWKHHFIVHKQWDFVDWLHFSVECSHNTLMMHPSFSCIIYNALGVATKHNYALLQFMVFFIRFSCPKYSKMTSIKKNHPMNPRKSIWTY
jgi:hypothetical protein